MDEIPLSPAQELDILIAQKVVGYSGIVREKDGRWFGISPRGNYRWLPRYSTDLAMAWKLLDRLSGQFSIQLDNTGFQKTGDGSFIPLWRCFVSRANDQAYVYAEDCTVPLAICPASGCGTV